MAAKRASLAELMGKGAAAAGTSGKLSLDSLHEILGDAMPELPKNAVGRYRLVRSLKARFGPNFRALPGVGDLVKEFDGHVETEKQIERIRQIKYSRSK